jgi:CheY-like chemotaxis protein
MTSSDEPCRILVVDDDPLIRDTLRDVLAGEGHPTQTAGHGAAALPLIEAERPQIIVLDMRMPVMNGWDFARELKARGISIPILVLTASQDARTWAREIGAVDFLAKPCDLLDLLDKVGKLSART